jgi:hypothetical protein
MRLSGQSPNQEAKCASVFHRFRVQVESDLADDRLGDEYIHAIYACQSTPVMRCSSSARLKWGLFLFCFFLFRREIFLRLRCRRIGKTS